MREARDTGERVTLTPEQVKSRRRRSRWIALALFAFCVVVFLITVIKMSGNMLGGGA